MIWGDYGRMDKKTFMGLVQIVLDDLDLSNIVIGWFKLFSMGSMTNMPPKNGQQGGSGGGASGAGGSLSGSVSGGIGGSLMSASMESFS